MLQLCKHVQDVKWKEFGRRIFFHQMYSYLLFTLLLVVTFLGRHYWKTTSIIEHVQQWLLMVLNTHFMSEELRQCYKNGSRAYARSITNIYDVLAHTSTMVSCIVAILHLYQLQEVAYRAELEALSICLVMAKLQVFMMVEEHTGVRLTTASVCAT